MKDFFVSYNKADRIWAEWIGWVLEEAGYSTSIQAWDFRPGGNFVLEMQKATTETEKTIAILSNDYLTAEFTQPEWADAFARDPSGNSRTLLPIRVAKCKPTGLLATRIYADLVGLNPKEAKEEVLGSLRERGKPISAPSFPGSESKPKATETPSPIAFPGVSSKAVEVWKEKLEFLLIQEAELSDPALLFGLQKQIEKVRKRLGELGANPN